MNSIVFYETQGKLWVAQVLEEKDSHLQVRGQGSSTQKIKIKDVLIKAKSAESVAQLMQQVGDMSEQVDLDLLWACAPEEVFGFDTLAEAYFGSGASALAQAAMWQALQGAPIYFGKKGRGQFVRQPFEQIQIAKAALAKKEAHLQQMNAWVEEMKEGRAPPEILQARDAILQKKNPNDWTYKAVVLACTALNYDVPQLMLHIGAFASAFELHRAVFLNEYYPRGLVDEALPEPVWAQWDEWLAAGLAHDKSTSTGHPEVFSIDDSQTTEIDDAFSVQILSDTQTRIGIHIAAPSLAVVRDDAADKAACERMSTLYTPGEKVTMLPDAWVAAFSLDANTIKPVVSIYVTVDTTQTGVAALLDVQSCVEKRSITANLRHDTPEMQLSAADLEGARTDYPYASALQRLWQGAQILSHLRDEMRGKPENNNRADFNFHIIRQQDEVLTGQEEVVISQRQRGSPIDKIVSEWMIFANVEWAKMLRDARVPALFRAQSAMGVRTQTHAQPHLAMGVPAYMWATSPLRRYADWVNQMQLLAVLRYGVTAPMKAPFAAKEVDLYTRVSRFDERYKAYNNHQSLMEKYWCLRWVAQHSAAGVCVLGAIVVREQLIRIAQIPLYLNALVEGIALQSRIRVQLQEIDWVALTVGVRVIAVLGASDEPLEALESLDLEQGETDELAVNEEDVVEPALESAPASESTAESMHELTDTLSPA